MDMKFSRMKQRLIHEARTFVATKSACVCARACTCEFVIQFGYQKKESVNFVRHLCVSVSVYSRICVWLSFLTDLFLLASVRDMERRCVHAFPNAVIDSVLL